MVQMHSFINFQILVFIIESISSFLVLLVAAVTEKNVLTVHNMKPIRMNSCLIVTKFEPLGKIKVNLSLCLTKHRAMKTY